MRQLTLLLWAGVGALTILSGCSGSLSIGQSKLSVPPGDTVEQAGDTIVVAAPAPVPTPTPPIVTVITGLTQAQQVRTLVRQLSRP